MISIYTVRFLLITLSYACFTWISRGSKLMVGWRSVGRKQNGRMKEKEGCFGSEDGRRWESEAAGRAVIELTRV